MFGMGGQRSRPQQPEPGPKRAAKAPALLAVTVQLTARQKDTLAQLGGDAWLREQLDRALPGTTEADD